MVARALRAGRANRLRTASRAALIAPLSDDATLLAAMHDLVEATFV